jgi:hypothetical protein
MDRAAKYLVPVMALLGVSRGKWLMPASADRVFLEVEVKRTG